MPSAEAFRKHRLDFSCSVPLVSDVTEAVALHAASSEPFRPSAVAIPFAGAFKLGQAPDGSRARAVHVPVHLPTIPAAEPANAFVRAGNGKAVAFSLTTRFGRGLLCLIIVFNGLSDPEDQDRCTEEFQQIRIAAVCQRRRPGASTKCNCCRQSGYCANSPHYDLHVQKRHSNLGGTSHLHAVDSIQTKSGNIGWMLSHIIDLPVGRARVRARLILHINRTPPIIRQ